jgi:DNA-binding response OmpR family regulator
MDVLIAEDDAITRLTLRQLLENEGYQCAEADNGRDAVDIARQRPPRLALLDVMMPGLDGFAAARLLRAAPETRGVPILFLTGRDDRSARAAARRAGKTTFLTKPFDYGELLDVVSIVVRRGPASSGRNQQVAGHARHAGHAWHHAKHQASRAR